MKDPLDLLWVRGGFPDSFLADSDEASLEWRNDFIWTYLKRDLPDLGPHLPAEQVYRLQRMPYRTEATYYRSSAGAEIDLLLGA